MSPSLLICIEFLILVPFCSFNFICTNLLLFSMPNSNHSEDNGFGQRCQMIETIAHQQAETDAVLAWSSHKHQLYCILCDSQADSVPDNKYWGECAHEDPLMGELKTLLLCPNCLHQSWTLYKPDNMKLAAPTFSDTLSLANMRCNLEVKKMKLQNELQLQPAPLTLQWNIPKRPHRFRIGLPTALAEILKKFENDYQRYIDICSPNNCMPTMPHKVSLVSMSFCCTWNTLLYSVAFIAGFNHK